MCGTEPVTSPGFPPARALAANDEKLVDLAATMLRSRGNRLTTSAAAVRTQGGSIHYGLGLDARTSPSCAEAAAISAAAINGGGFITRAVAVAFTDDDAT